MGRLPTAVVGDAYTSSFAWDLLSDLVDVGNRMAGQAGEREAAELLADGLETAGLSGVSIDEFSIPGWWRESSSLTLSAPVERAFEADHDVIALPGSPAGSVEGELVDVGYGTGREFEEADVEGKVVMVRSDVPSDHRWVHRMEKYASAFEGGAVGFVFANHVEGALPPTGEVGYHRRPGPIPAVGVSKELGSRLSRYATTSSEGCYVSLDVDCRNEPTTSYNVEAVVEPAGSSGTEEVLLTAHLDAHDVSEGANDNGAGSVLVTETGRLLTQVADELDTRVRVVIFGAEEIGLYGAYHWAETRDLSAVKAVLNVDGAGTSRDLRISTSGFSDLGDAIRTATDRFDAPLSVDGSVSPHGDQWAFVQEGVPALFVTTMSSSSGRGWGHTHADTLDKLDPLVLRDVAIQLAECTLEVADSRRTFERRSRASVRGDLADGYVRELKVGGRWPYGTE